MREKTDREYQVFIDSLPKLAANWDRNARAPRPEKVPEIKTKKQSKPKKPAMKTPKVADSQGAVFEDVQFETPPMTPDLPPREIIAVAPNNNKKDDDFWNFYDQGLPSIR